MALTLLIPTAVMAATSGSVELSTTIPAQISIKVTGNDGISTVHPISFGSVAVGVQSAWSQEIMITNDGTDAFVASTSYGGAFYNDCLIIQKWGDADWESQIWARSLGVTIPAGSSIVIRLAVLPTPVYGGSSPSGWVTFIATPTP
jgi:hypothetical protein